MLGFLFVCLFSFVSFFLLLSDLEFSVSKLSLFPFSIFGVNIFKDQLMKTLGIGCLSLYSGYLILG